MLGTLRTLGLLRPLSVAGLVVLALMLGFWTLGLAVPLEPGFASFVSGAVVVLLDFNLALNIIMIVLALVVLASSYRFPWGAALQAALQALLVWGAFQAHGLVERLLSSPIAL